MAVERMMAALHIEREETPLTQLIITKYGELNKQHLETYIMKLKLEELGHEYAVVSIIGPQSSGKSTLLNHLFGTTFQEMDAMKGRTQTTKGIWIARAVDIEPCTLVIDVEGSDGVERGVDGTLFEKQSALFALAVSDVVLVNMWCKDIGREHGGSRPLLKIVFEEFMNMKSQRKITLLFVLRDKTKSPSHILEAMLHDSIEKIFNSVLKQDPHENSSLSDLFNVEVYILPNFEYQEELFLEEVKTLRKRFVNSTSLGGLAGDKTDKVDSSKFSYSIKTMWKSIKENRNLDLPAHKIMVDTVRCDEIMEKSYSDFKVNKDWQDLQTSLKSGPIVGFGVKLSSIINTCLSQYDAKVIHCDGNVQILKRQTLLLKLLKCIRPVSDEMLEHQYSKAASAFQRALDSSDLSPGQILESINKCRELSMSLFDEGCKEMEIEHMKLDVSKVLDRVEVDIQQYAKHSALQIAYANAEAATAAAKAEAAANKTAAAQAAADAKSAADTLAAAHAAVQAAHDANSSTAARNQVQQAEIAELRASTYASTAAHQAMVAQLAAELAAAKQREAARELKENRKICTIL